MDKSNMWRAEFERVLRAALAAAEPKIIIWGPGRRHRQDYEKRKRIKKAIQKEVPHGKVSFPEDRDVQEASSDMIVPDELDANELLQAAAADIVIALDISAAPGEEVARYSGHYKIGPKLLVVAQKERLSAYQEAIRNKLKVCFVSTEELISCQTTTHQCLKHVRTWCVKDYVSH